MKKNIQIEQLFLEKARHKADSHVVHKKGDDYITYDDIKELQVGRATTDDHLPYLHILVRLQNDKQFVVESWGDFELAGYIAVRKELPNGHKAHKNIVGFINGAIQCYFECIKGGYSS